MFTRQLTYQEADAIAMMCGSHVTPTYVMQRFVKDTRSIDEIMEWEMTHHMEY